MSQIDKIIYVPLLVWFILLFGLLYIISVSYLLSLFYHTIRTRHFLYIGLLKAGLAMINAYYHVSYVFSKIKTYHIITNITMLYLLLYDKIISDTTIYI